MPIPTLITDLSTTPASNSPQGSDSPTQGDDYLRAIQAIMRTEHDSFGDTASTANGDALIGVKPTLTGSRATTQHEVNERSVNIMQFTSADSTGATEQDTVFAAAVTALASTGGTVYLPRGSFKLTTSTFTLAAKQNIRFFGAGGISNNSKQGTTITLYNTGAGNIIDMRSSIGCSWEGIFFNVLNAATGSLFKIGNDGTNGDSAYWSIKNCGFSNGGNATVTYINTDKSICGEVHGNYFTQGKIAINGQDGAGGSYSNVVSVRKNVFIGQAQTPIQNCGESWTIDENTFEPISSGAAGAVGISGTAPALGLSFKGNWTGDVTTGGGTWITLAGKGFTVTGNEFGGQAATNCISLVGVTGAKINGNNFNTFSTAIDFTSGTNEDIDPSGNNYTSVTTKFGTTANFGGYASAGYMYIGPLIRQWGTTSVTTGVQGTATFSKTFGTGGPWTISAAVINPPAAGNVVVCSTITTSSMKLDCTGTAGGQTVYWEVMGPRS